MAGNSEVQPETNEEYEGNWCTGMLECRMCGDRHVSVWPEEIMDEDCQECPNCGHMTCEPIEDIIEGPFDVEL